MRREIIIAQSGMSENARWTRDLREFLRMKRAELKGQGYVVEGGMGSVADYSDEEKCLHGRLACVMAFRGSSTTIPPARVAITSQTGDRSFATPRDSSPPRSFG